MSVDTPQEWATRWPGRDHGLPWLTPELQPVNRVIVTIVIEPEGQRFHVQVSDAMYLRPATPDEAAQALREVGWSPANSVA